MNNSMNPELTVNEIDQLLRASRAFRAGLDLQQTLEIIVEAIHDALGFNRATIRLVEIFQDKPVLKRYAKVGLSDEDFQKLPISPPLEDYLNLMKDEFQVSQSYFIPHSQKHIWEGKIGVDTADLSYSGIEGKWHAEDLLLVPIRDADNEMIGLISVDDPKDRKIPNIRTHHLLEVFANHAAFAIKTANIIESANFRIWESTEHLERQKHDLQQSLLAANTLSRVDHALLNSSLSSDDIYQIILKFGNLLTDADYADILIFDSERHSLIIRKSTTKEVEGIGIALVGITGWVAEQGQPKIVSDTQSDPIYLNLPEVNRKTKSELAVPLIWGKTVEGVLNFESKNLDAFEAKHLSYAQELAIRATLAIRYATHIREMEAIREINQAILNLTDDLQKVLEIILDRTLKLVHASHGNILLREGENLIINATTGDQSRIGTMLPIEGTISGLPITEGRTIRMGNVDLHPYYQWILKEERMRSEMVVRLMHEGNDIGVINVESPNPDAFSERDQKLIEKFADQASIAIQIARHQDQLELLSEIDRGILNSRNLDQLLRFILEKSLQIIGAHHGNVMLVEGTHLEIRESTGIRDKYIGKKLPIDKSISGLPVIQKAPVIISDVEKEPLYRRILDEEYMRSELAVPLMENNIIIGVLNLESPKKGFFKEHHKRLLQAIANQAAVAIKMERIRQRLLQQESINNITMESASLLHEIGNKAFPIRDAAERLENSVKNLNNDNLTDIQLIKLAAIQLHHLTKQVLSPARDLRYGPLHIEELIDIGLAQMEMPEAKIEINKDLPDDIPLIRADERALVDVIVNLLNNAIESMEKVRNPTLTISACSEPDLEMIRVDIIDTGCGIDENEWDNIWRPFFVIKPKYGRAGGSGLGLYTCKTLMMRMGGEIFIASSELEKGTTMSFRIPQYSPKSNEFQS